MVVMQTLWHFTTQPIDLLRQTGLQPYPFDPKRRDFDIVRQELKRAKGDETGIWLWVKCPSDELIRDFLLWKVTNGQGDRGTLLEVKCSPDHLLGHLMNRGGAKYHLSHKLYLDPDPRAGPKHDEPFDICLYEIREFVPVARTEISITRYGQVEPA